MVCEDAFVKQEGKIKELYKYLKRNIERDFNFLFCVWCLASCTCGKLYLVLKVILLMYTFWTNNSENVFMIVLVNFLSVTGNTIFEFGNV